MVRWKCSREGCLAFSGGEVFGCPDPWECVTFWKCLQWLAVASSYVDGDDSNEEEYDSEGFCCHDGVFCCLRD